MLHDLLIYEEDKIIVKEATKETDKIIEEYDKKIDDMNKNIEKNIKLVSIKTISSPEIQKIHRKKVQLMFGGTVDCFSPGPGSVNYINYFIKNNEDDEE